MKKRTTLRKSMLFLVPLVAMAGVAYYLLREQEAPPATLPPPPAEVVESVNARDGAAMVLVSAGDFLMGSTPRAIAAWVKAHSGSKIEQFANEQPQRQVHLDAYYIYKTAVTVAQYRRFCEETKREMPREPEWGWQESHPMVNVTWNDAMAYAQWANAALPTEAQWEKAARGTDGRLFPWGNDWPPSGKVGNFADEVMKREKSHLIHIVGYDDGHAYTAPAGAFPAGASAYGALDMAGNVWEWCADLYAPAYPDITPVANPTGPVDGNTRVLRGGSWNNFDPGYFRTTMRLECDPTYLGPYFGFRCVTPAEK